MLLEHILAEDTYIHGEFPSNTIVYNYNSNTNTWKKESSSLSSHSAYSYSHFGHPLINISSSINTNTGKMTVKINGVTVLSDGGPGKTNISKNWRDGSFAFNVAGDITSKANN